MATCRVDPGLPVWDLPDPRTAPAGEDVVCVGGELDAATVLYAYSRGLFPMEVEPELLGWWSPDPRGVLPIDSLRITRSLRASMRRFEFSFDTDFVGVMRACADPAREHGWITQEFIDTYAELHRLGWAHSVEVRRDGELVGGLYGIEIGGLFAGESMFHRDRDASKAALVALVAQLDDGCDRLIDVQWSTPHLASLGVIELDRAAYLDRLARVLRTDPVL